MTTAPKVDRRTKEFKALNPEETLGTNGTEHASTTKTISIAEDRLQMVMDRMDKLEKENTILRSIQDQSRLRQADAHLDGDTRPRIRLRMINEKVIVSWGKMPLDDVRIIRGEIVENQLVSLTMQDGQVLEISLKSYSDSYSLSDYYPVEDIIIDKTGRTFKVELPDGEYINIHEKFIN